jgi:excisionase family DNA binding protein
MAKANNKPAAEAVNPSALLTKRQAADYIQVTPRYIERCITSGRLRALKPSSGIVRIRQSDLDAFLEASASI